MKNLLIIFDVILIRLLAFSLAFFISLTLIPNPQIENSRILNVGVYKRPTNEDCTRPNPLILLIQIDNNNRLTLNYQELSFMDLEHKLAEIFRFRTDFYVTNESGTEIEKTVFIQADDTIKYEELEKIIDSITKAGASHIFLDLFKEKCIPSGSFGGFGCGFRTKVKHPKKLKKPFLKDNTGKGQSSFFKTK